MANEVLMPQMGESIAEGTIVRWIKKVGDTVDRDEPLFEISTDKVDAEIPSPTAGVVLEIHVKEGETVPVNSVVALIGSAGEGGISLMRRNFGEAVENLTAFAAAGCQLIFFGTGVGNPIGNMVSPTVKVSGNVNTLRTMADNIDFDASDILEKSASVGSVGDRLYDFAIEVASGTRTSSEILDVRETAISRFAPTI